MAEPDQVMAEFHKKLPTIAELQQFSPLEAMCSNTASPNAPVIKITNMAFGTQRYEIAAFLPANTILDQPQGSAYSAIHMIVDSNGKCDTAFVELKDLTTAQMIIHNHTPDVNGWYPQSPMLSGRHVRFTIANQTELMEAIFRNANVTFVNVAGSFGVIYHQNDEECTGFIGNFKEIMETLERWARTPRISTNIKLFPQRPFDALISILAKYPWHLSDKIPMAERDFVFKITLKMIETLAFTVYSPEPVRMQQCHYDTYPLHKELLEELLLNALKCPAFSEHQRFKLAESCDHVINSPVYISPLAKNWPFNFIRRKDDVSEERLRFYFSLISQAEKMYEPNAAKNFRERIMNALEVSAMKTGYEKLISMSPSSYHFTDQQSINLDTLAKLEDDAINGKLKRLMTPESP